MLRLQGNTGYMGYTGHVALTRHISYGGYIGYREEENFLQHAQVTG